MNKTQVAVSSFLNSINKRNERIKYKIKELSQESTQIHSEIKQLTKRLVELDLDGNMDGQDELNKRISSLRTVHNELQDKISAYKDVPADKAINKNDIDTILDIARKEQKDRYAEIAKRQMQISGIEDDIKRLQDKRDSLKREATNLKDNTEARSLLPLLSYIEPRKVKHFHQETLIEAILSGVTGELLEQYIEHEDITSNEPRNICVSEQVHPAY